MQKRVLSVLITARLIFKKGREMKKTTCYFRHHRVYSIIACLCFSFVMPADIKFKEYLTGKSSIVLKRKNERTRN